MERTTQPPNGKDTKNERCFSQFSIDSCKGKRSLNANDGVRVG